MPILLVEGGKNRGEALVLRVEGAVTLGREKTCDLRIPDVMASRRHCEVRTRAGRFFLHDLKSSNGTFLNGARLAPDEERPIELEDKIQVGSTIISLVPDEARQSRGELTGRTVGGYRIEERLGRGVMGTVYKATQLSLDRPVALKILARELARDRKRVEMFLSEARAAGKLNHPNLVQVYDVGAEGELYFFSMEFMAGGSVEEKLHARGKLALADALKIAIDAAKGLEYAEREGLIHRDIKPANLMENADGVTKIGDLGIARRAGTGEDEAGIAGSPLYMAPEQARGEPLDSRADFYALGATLHHLLAGEPPFQGSSPREVILKHFDEPPPSLAGAPELGIPDEVAALVLRLLAKDREARPMSASALLEEIRALEARHVKGTMPPEAEPGGWRGERRALAVGFALFVLLLAGLTVKVRGDAEKARRARVLLDAQNQVLTMNEALRRVLAQAAGERERAAAQAVREARERDADLALEAANRYLAEHAQDDLEGALARYKAVLRDFAGTAAEPRAKEQIDKVAPLFQTVEEERRAQEAREVLAKETLRGIADAIDATPPEGLAALRDRLEAARPALEGTDAAKQASDVRRAITAKVDRSLRAADEEADRALKARDPAAARAAVERVAAWNMNELRPWVDGKRRVIEAAEHRAKESALEARHAQEEAELALIRKSDDRERLRELRLAEARAALEALLPRLETEEGRGLARARIATIDLELKALRALVVHVNEKKKPPLTMPIGSFVGVATAADDGGITFQARENAGIEVRERFARIAPEDWQRFLAAVDGPKDEIGFALAAILADLGDEERSRRELQRIKEPGAVVKPLVERVLAGKGR